MKKDRKAPVILLVDDSLDNLRILGRILEKEGFVIKQAKTGEEALSKIKELMPDIVLLDIMMPGIDGFEVSSFLKYNPETRNIPVIFLTAKSGIENVVKGFDSGAADYITKPFKIMEVVARINSQYAMKMFRDTTAEQMELLTKKIQDLTIENETLKKRTQTADKLYSAIAHDLVNPFQGFVGLSEIFMNETASLSSGEKDEIAEEIFNSSKKLYNRLENLLNWTRIKTGSFKPIPEELDLSKHVEEELEKNRFLFAGIDIEIRNRVENEAKVYFDKRLFSLFFSNIFNFFAVFKDFIESIEIVCEKNSSYFYVAAEGGPFSESEIEFVKNESLSDFDALSEKYGLNFPALLTKYILTMLEMRFELELEEPNRLIAGIRF